MNPLNCSEQYSTGSEFHDLTWSVSGRVAGAALIQEIESIDTRDEREGARAARAAARQLERRRERDEWILAEAGDPPAMNAELIDEIEYAHHLGAGYTGGDQVVLAALDVIGNYEPGTGQPELEDAFLGLAKKTVARIEGECPHSTS